MIYLIMMTILYDSNGRNIFGRGFLVHENQSSGMDFILVDERIGCLRFRDEIFNTTQARVKEKDHTEKNSMIN
jgi:hypothetical protein